MEKHDTVSHTAKHKWPRGVSPIQYNTVRMGGGISEAARIWEGVGEVTDGAVLLWGNAPRLRHLGAMRWCGILDLGSC